MCACVESQRRLSQTKRNLIAVQQQTLIQSLSATNGAFHTPSNAMHTWRIRDTLVLVAGNARHRLFTHTQLATILAISVPVHI